eukprot:scaffold35770_cov101-Isochrysis_galbana.AAC.5
MLLRRAVCVGLPGGTDAWESSAGKVALGSDAPEDCTSSCWPHTVERTAASHLTCSSMSSPAVVDSASGPANA